VPHPASDKLRRFKRIAGGLAVLAIAIAGVAFYLNREGPDPALAARSRNPGVPVSVADVAKEDVPVILTGLGTVQASLTVSIHSQVDGKLQDVFFTEGQRVRKGDVLAKIDPRLFQAALDQAKAKKAQDVAQLAGYEKDLARFQALAAKGFDTQQNLDQQQAKVETAKALVMADDAAIETAQTNLDYTDIRAPSDGRMGVRLVDPGNTVHAADTGAIAVLVRTQPTFVTFTLPAHTLDAVREAMKKGEVQVTAYDRDNRQQIGVGKLQTVDNRIDQATASYTLKATFANDDEKLWPGQFVNARLLLQTLKQVLVVPNGAVQRGPKGLFAWSVGADNRASPKSIEVALRTESISVVSGGLAEGERVVTDGQYKLQDNAAVSIGAKPEPQDKPAS